MRTGRSFRLMRLTTFLPRRQAFLAAGAATYAAVFALFLIFERPGLGIGHGFYLAVIFVSLARGPMVGLGAGVLATVLYAIGIWINPHVSPATIPTLATSIRAVTYVAVGVAVGWYASRNRTLNRRLLELTNQLQMLAERDVLTGLPNTRAFEPAITRRINDEESFALLLADVDGSSGSTPPTATTKGTTPCATSQSGSTTSFTRTATSHASETTRSRS
jgi:predicted signal transduction protein with EAL and GGDEF domain